MDVQFPLSAFETTVRCQDLRAVPSGDLGIQSIIQSAILQWGKHVLAAGIIQILVGVVAIVFGFTAGEFYPAFMRRPRPDEKPLPKWLGRTISAVVGLWFILPGLSDLRHH